MLGVAVVGCGGIARQYHLRALRHMRSARVVAVADPDPAARAQAGRSTGAVPFADAHEAIARPDVDAVVVCAPNGVHAELAIAALDAGRHLYLEKPIATSVADGQRVLAAADRAGTVATVGLTHRQDPLYRRARGLLHEGALGQLREVSTTYREIRPGGGLPGWKRTLTAGGGVLLDLGTHHLDLLRWMTGRPLAEIDYAAFESLESEQDEAIAHARLAGGANVEASFGYGDERICGWVFAGDDGWLAIDRCTRTLTLARGGRQPRRRARHDAARTRLLSLPGVRRERIFKRALRSWIECARGRGDAAAVPTLRDGLLALEAVESIQAAAAEPVPA